MDNKLPAQAENNCTCPPGCCSGNRWFKISVIILGILIVLGLFGNIYLLLKKQTPLITSATPTASPAQIVATPTIVPTANWKTYRNVKYGFEIKYHPELAPNESDDGRIILFGTGLGGGNYLKSLYGFEVKIKDMTASADFRSEIVNHVADKLDSEGEVVINGNTGMKYEYKIFITTDYVPITTFVANTDKYGYGITATTSDIDQILSTFKFLK